MSFKNSLFRGRRQLWYSQGPVILEMCSWGRSCSSKRKEPLTESLGIYGFPVQKEHLLSSEQSSLKNSFGGLSCNLTISGSLAVMCLGSRGGRVALTSHHTPDCTQPSLLLLNPNFPVFNITLLLLMIPLSYVLNYSFSCSSSFQIHEEFLAMLLA